LKKAKKMIKLDRTKIQAPVILTQEKGEGWKETQDAIDFFFNKKNDVKVDYKVYKSDEVKEKLDLLCRSKCAYCESLVPGSPYDIEHFRPKGAVTEAEITKGKKEKQKVVSKNGYYWLAANWDNLLYSCIDCNRGREHQFADRDPGQAGKKTLFPLADENKRAKNWNDDLQQEEPLLLNPVHDEPDRHLLYVLKESGLSKDGGPIVFLEANMIGNEISRKGDASIRIYGLNRQNLTHARHQTYLSIKSSMNAIDALHEIIIEWEAKAELEMPKEMKDIIQVTIKQHYETMGSQLKNLARALKDDSPYLGMARYFIIPFLAKHNLKLPDD
jgi:uncharacterized protein (TIGR02646 family)